MQDVSPAILEERPMRLAAVIATACTVAALGAVPASAAAKAKPICNDITDDSADAKVSGQGPSDDSLDITGGDFAGNAKTITAIIRLKAFANPSPQSPLGQAYYVSFNAPGTGDVLTLSAGFFPTGTEYKYGYQAIDPNTTVNTSYTLGDAKGSIKGNEIRISVDIAKYPQARYMKKGVKITGIQADARRVYGQRAVPSQQVGPVRAPLGGLTLTLDTADGKPFFLGAKTCVAIGK
jgi:hypothetical protein